MGLVKAFRDLGVEGKNLTFFHECPAEQAERYPILARELVDANVDLLIAVTQDGAIALRKATSSIPIVFVLGRKWCRTGC